MSLSNVKRFIALSFLILFVVCPLTVFAQDKDWRQVSFGELQSKALEIEPQTDGEIILGEVPDFNNSVDFSAKHYAHADVSITREQYDKATDIRELTKAIEHGVTLDEQDVFKRETAGTRELKITTNFFAAPNTKSNNNLERRYRELLSGDWAKNPRLIFQTDIFIRKSSQYFRPTGSLNLKSFSLNRKENKSEKDKRIYYSASQTQGINSFSKDEDALNDTANKIDESFRWRSAIKQSLMFLAVQHGYAFTQAKTRRELKGNFFGDYVKSVKSLHGWADGGRFFTNYIAHPLQGSFTGYIQVQNDPKGLRQRFGTSADYWRSRMKAMAWTAAWSTQFEIGPLSQASIGNVGLKGKQTYVDLVMTPLGGTAMLISEDAIDRLVMERIERRTDNFYVIIFSRMLLSPTRTIANLFRFKTPWYRDRPRL
ncbi:MAG: hypothetical protein M3388_06850 [Acidobacteriota bacterium]|nr:hypothetical protein [Acidobacteriota bacterium]